MKTECEVCGYRGWLYQHDDRAVCRACWVVAETEAAQARGERRINLMKMRRIGAGPLDGLDVERLAAAMNDAQILASEIRLGHDLRVPAARILSALRTEAKA